MPKTYFQFKQFTIHQDKCAMKVCTDSCVFGSVLPSKNYKNNFITSALDIGSGTGLLSLMYAQINNQAKITAIELDKNAAIQANENIIQSTFKNQINIKNIDFTNFTNAEKFDLIFSNPPFYENELKSNNNNKNIAHHSTNLSIELLLKKSKELLLEDGVFCLLLPYKRMLELEKLFTENKLFIYKKIILRQNEARKGFRLIYFLNKESLDTKIIEEEIIIKKGNEYSKKFKDLLSEFYLNL